MRIEMRIKNAFRIVRGKHPYFLGVEFTWEAAPFPPGPFLVCLAWEKR